MGWKMAEEEEYYTPPQAARILSLSRRRVTQMLNDGHLEGERLDSGRWKIPAAAVTALLKRRRAKQPPPRSRNPQANKTMEEIKERSALLERRIERLTDSLSRLFDRFERLEDRMHELEKERNR